MKSKIQKSIGQTETEKNLAAFCASSFLNLWFYPNPYKDDGKELCDIIVAFDDRVFLFFDRESAILDKEGDNEILWRRWKKTVIDKQIATARGAVRYLSSGRDIYLDAARKEKFPIPIAFNPDRVHKIIVAHGAARACKAYSDQNIYGSIGVSYCDAPGDGAAFAVELRRSDICHILDSVNMPIIFGELDTIYDFSAYITEKERAIRHYKVLTYCGEEDLVAYYFENYSTGERKHKIGPVGRKKDVDHLMIGQGFWATFESSAARSRRKMADRVSYFWDAIIQRTSENALNGRLQGGLDVFRRPSAILEMTKEPRFARRALSEAIIDSVDSFPRAVTDVYRSVGLYPSFYPHKSYVFLQLGFPPEYSYIRKEREVRLKLLEVACAAAKIRDPSLKIVIGICVDAPNLYNDVAEYFILMNFQNWSDEMQQEYADLNKDLKFFQTPQLVKRQKRAHQFPPPPKESKPGPPGRNDPCLCGSGVKYKKCCLNIQKRH